MTLELAAATNERLERLVVATEADSRTEVIRRALRVYELLQEVTAGGGQVVLRTGAGVETRLLLT